MVSSNRRGGQVPPGNVVELAAYRLARVRAGSSPEQLLRALEQDTAPVAGMRGVRADSRGGLYYSARWL